jgi:hypothetical protein
MGATHLFHGFALSSIIHRFYFSIIIAGPQGHLRRNKTKPGVSISLFTRKIPQKKGKYGRTSDSDFDLSANIQSSPLPTSGSITCHQLPSKSSCKQHGCNSSSLSCHVSSIIRFDLDTQGYQLSVGDTEDPTVIVVGLVR